jgi:hypothetical protein
MTKLKRKRPPDCPNCFGEPQVFATKFGPRSECCGLWSYGFKKLVSAEVHWARREAHKAFDPIWKEELLARAYAYKLIRREFGLSADKAHFSNIDDVELLRDIINWSLFKYAELKRSK